MADWSMWESAEEEIRGRIAGGLEDSVTVAADVEDIAFQLLRSASVPETKPDVFVVHANLLTRALQDLRVSCWSALNGYIMESWTLAASCMEASYTIGFIGADEGRAARWQGHADPQKSPWNMYDCLLHSQRYLGIESDSDRLRERAQEEYRLYQHLCMAKHANPIAERNRYLDRQTGRMYLTPAFSENMLHEGRLGIALAARSVTAGVWAIRRTHCPSSHNLDERLIHTARRGLRLIKDWKAALMGSEGGSEQPVEPR